MIEHILIVSGLSFGLSFIFALGGVGAAVVLVPVLFWMGIPLNEAKPTGLFVNTISMIGASYDNIKHKRLDFRLGTPIIVSSLILAPIGAYVSVHIPQKIVLIVFIAFLVFASALMLFFRSAKYSDQFREDRPIVPMIVIGTIAGFISGLLGVGGGSLIAPILIFMGFNPKKVAAITAFVVPFSSLTGFIAYAMMGHFEVLLILPAGAAAYAGGYLATVFMQNRLKPSTVKRLLAVILLVLAVKLIFKL